MGRIDEQLALVPGIELATTFSALIRRRLPSGRVYGADNHLDLAQTAEAELEGGRDAAAQAGMAAARFAVFQALALAITCRRPRRGNGRQPRLLDRHLPKVAEMVELPRSRCRRRRPGRVTRWSG